MTKSLSEYAETLQNELVENIELRNQIEDLYNYLQSIVNSLPDKIYEIDENGIINFVSRGLRKKRNRLPVNLKINIFWNLSRPDTRNSYCPNGKMQKKVFITL